MGDAPEKQSQDVKIRPDRKKNFAAPNRARSRARFKTGKIELERKIAEDKSSIKSRSSQLTVCLLLLVSSISCISPFLSLHLRHRVGLLLFESILVQLRASLLSVIFCSTILVVLVIVVVLFINRKYSHTKDIILQKLLRILISLFALLSAIAYLSLVLVVPHLVQIQRMPMVTFDCEANLITVENCNQQFAIQSGELAYLDALGELVFGREVGSEKLIEKLNCLKYNSKQLESLAAPTRFLLHNCALVCLPQRRQYHQFSDDLNGVSQQGDLPNKNRFTAPYDEDRGADMQSYQVDKRLTDSSNSNQVSLKICFTGEFSGGSTYKQFCVTNLVNPMQSKNQQLSKTLTIGQLNAMLRQLNPTEEDQGQPSLDGFEADQASDNNSFGDRATTHYINPVVQFESHFKNWPQMGSETSSNDDSFVRSDAQQSLDSDEEPAWCRFKPIPPFVVNDKPFNDIQCSLEHEYTMSTISSAPDADARSSLPDQIYLKKSLKPEAPKPLSEDESPSVSNNERCNIQCKVNILYQVQRHIQQSNGKLKDLHYYLPLKQCVVITGNGDKLRTSNYYIFFRNIADSSLALVFIFLDVFLLLESIDTQRYQLEARKSRLIGLLVVIIVIPVLASLLLNIGLSWHVVGRNKSYSSSDTYLVSFVQDKLLPTVKDLLERIWVGSVSGAAGNKRRPSMRSGTRLQTNSSDSMIAEDLTSVEPSPTEKPLSYLITDDYMIPFLLYTIFMLALSVRSLSLPIVASSSPLVRVSSSEELGLSPTKMLSPSKSELELDSYRTTKHKQVSKKVNQLVTGREIPETDLDSSNELRKKKVSLILITLTAIFMGALFSTANIAETPILEETLLTHQQSPQSSLRSLYMNSNSWYILIAKSCINGLILMIVILLSNEISIYFSHLSPFKATSSSSNAIKEFQIHQNEVKLLLQLSISLLVYSLRFYALSAIDLSLKIKWLLILLFYMGELFNFPLVWFAISARLQEIVHELRLCRSSQDPSQKSEFSKSDHLLAQATLALAYFVIGRAIALFAHSFYESLYLYSENIDWFITSFYGESRSTSQDLSGKLKLNLQSSYNGTSNPNRQIDRQETLFSPLPGELQTYLYASRLFLKYISILCSIIGFALILKLISIKYVLWKEAKTKIRHRAAKDSESEHIDDRLSIDLKRIRKPPMGGLTLHQGSGDDPMSRVPSPRAKILFHYNTKHSDEEDDSSVEGSFEPEMGSVLDPRKFEPRPVRGELRIPIEVEQEPDNIGRHYFEGKNSTEVAQLPNDDTIEMTVRRHTKKVRIFEDCEDWPSSDGDERTIVKAAEEKEVIQPAKRRKNITFAPTATLIGDGRTSSRQVDTNAAGRHSQLVAVARKVPSASPEPSIGDTSDSDSIDDQ